MLIYLLANINWSQSINQVEKLRIAATLIANYIQTYFYIKYVEYEFWVLSYISEDNTTSSCVIFKQKVLILKLQFKDMVFKQGFPKCLIFSQEPLRQLKFKFNQYIIIIIHQSPHIY